MTVWITTNCGKFLKWWEHQTSWPASWEICVQVKKQYLEPDMEQQTGSILGKEYVKALIVTLVFYVHAEDIKWNARLDEAHAGIKIARRNMNNVKYVDDIILMAENKEELKSLLMKVKEEGEKTGSKN